MDIRNITTRFLLLLLLLFPSTLWAGELRLSVAGSMIDVIKEVGAAFTEKHPEARLLSNFASSGALAKQLTAGAPADVYISANPKWMDYVVAQGIVPAATVGTLAYNRMVLVGRPNLSIGAMSDLNGLARIALGSPKSVPAGRYAQQALAKAGLYQSLLAEGKLIMAKDVRQALLYADRGEVDVAFVYATDALLAGQAKILLEVPAELYPRVSYPMGLTVAGADKEEALAFMEFLKGKVAKEIFVRHGFVVEE
ncbi:molybdate ABC transporter substrate-binding protein [Syntrophotalea acetylenivorans]|uniref:Molybdate ABC transporter substrate-binding protein n=1 Tax=Syntrophotalea acetylenivorans TaxID=1842532 RepID=A0A1L3GKV9_9BACT|nr:molybdate ABC transporter substrate-binding protein [Syntrophotalea acetylenivorans]APG26541.1 molybdate ABC transporter substrate-binding protein [Syntrophotalea acetylenivorans]